METGGGGERLDSQNLRSFLRIKEEDHINHSDGRGNVPGVTFNSVVADKRGPGEIQRTQSNRTLLDIIREDSGGREGKKSWRHFKDKLRLRRNGGGSAWTPTVPVPTSDIPIHHNRNQNRRPSTGFAESAQFDSSGTAERVSRRFQHTSSLAMRRLQRERNDDDDDEEDEGRRSGGDAEEEEEDDEEGSGEGEAAEQPPLRMSLMSLLAETDRQMGLDGSAFMTEEDDDDEEEEETAGGGVSGGGYNTCCVCMVRHKGAAFIPCGHTFCRMCSRELWVQRGNCPLCNNYILEILDIF